MSAITGMFLINGRAVDSNLFKKMNDSLRHRGPDGSGIWVNGPVALGHQMLHTTSESLHEKLPFKDETSGLVITADARIDNRDELAPLLKLENSKNVPDSLFILKAYQKWGQKCPEKLLGDFAFAIWEENEKKLFCARDHIGVKPFYYYLSNDSFFFATEIKAILSNPEVKYSLNETKVAYFLSDMYQDREITFYEDILRLPAATNLIINFDSFKLEKYWELDHNKRIVLESESEYSKLFLKIFNNAVKCRLRSAFPLGSMLSGGLDSSSIVCTAREILLKNGGYPLKTFSLTFEETPESDERHYIQYVLKKGFLNPNFVNADNYSPVFNLNPLLWQNDEAIRSLNLYYDYLLCQLAKKEGVRILLDGLGGDSTVSHGKGLIIDYIKNNQWKKFFEEVRGTSKRKNLNTIKIIGDELINNYPDLFIWKVLFNKKTKDSTKMILNKDFARDINLNYKIDSFSNNKLKIPEKARQYHFNAINSALHQHTLEEKDKISAAFNIEPRYPFYDVRLIEFCLAIPSEQKRKNGWNRFTMRKAMNNILPKEIQCRKTKKTGGRSNIRNFINFDKDFIEFVICNNNKIIHDYVDIFVIQNMYQKFKNKQHPKYFFELWKCVSFGLWMSQTKFK